MRVHRGGPTPKPHLLRWLEGARPPKHAHAPSAEFRTVPAARQAKVTAALRQTLSAQLSSSPAVKDLTAHVGAPDFYDTLAKYDPKCAAQWHEMAKVQREFAAAEPKYDAKTRAYSESMRLTLHAAVLQHFAAPETNHGLSLYDRFIALHPTAFHQNGGWVDNLQIPLAGALAVAEATPGEMWLNAAGLFQGSFITDAPTIQAAQWVREARRAALGGWGPGR